MSAELFDSNECDVKKSVQMVNEPKTSEAQAVKKKATRRGIASLYSTSAVEDDIAVPFYTGRVNVLREEKKNLYSQTEFFANEEKSDSEPETIPEAISDPEPEPEPVQKTARRDRSRKPIAIEDVDAIAVEDLPLSPPKPLKENLHRKKPAKRKCAKLLMTIENSVRQHQKALMLEKVEPDGPIVIDDAESNTDENRTVSLKIRWRSEILRLQIKRNEKFGMIFPKLSELTKVPIGELLLTFKDDIIKSEDTPITVGVTISDILDCSKLSSDSNISDGYKDPNVIELKLQTKDMKKKLSYSIHKNEPLSVLIEKFASARNISTNILSLQFDGEDLDLERSPMETDLEDDFCIDVIIHAKT